MEPTADELAGVAELFGALTRGELERALSELAFKRGTEVEDPDGRIDDAVASYHLVTVERDDETLLMAGPTAFPELPDGAGDLPHILDVPDRDVDRETLVEAVEHHFRSEAGSAVAEGDADRIDELLDLSYELDVWGAVDIEDARRRLVDATE